ncbi:MAG: WG repeat-containing protein [Chitinophagaceae bacterium]|nr:WG repeat-containing protein [Chitinophagaceae bacterium]
MVLSLLKSNFSKNIIRYCIFSLALLSAQAQAPTKSFSFFEENGKKGLKNHAGEIIIPAQYNQLGWTRAIDTPLILKNTLGYKYNNFWGILTLSHKKITAPIYDAIHLLPNKLLLVSFKSHNSTLSLFGIIDEQNNPIVPIQYFSIELVNPYKNIYIVSSFLKNQVLYGLVSHTNTIVPIEYKKLTRFSTNIYKATSHLNTITLFYEQGDTVFPQEYENIVPLNTRIFITKQRGSYGVMDKNGNTIHKNTYKNITKINDTLVKIEPYSQWFLINEENKAMQSFVAERIVPIHNTFYKITKNEKDSIFTLAHLAGRQTHNASIPLNGGIYPDYRGQKIFQRFQTLIQKQTYEYIKGYSEGLIAIKKDKKYGFVDTAHKMVVTNRYEDVELFFEGLAAVKILGKWGFINTQEDIIIQNIYQQVSSFSNGNAIVKFKEKYHLIDRQGKNTLDLELDTLLLLKPNLYLLKKNKKYGIYNTLHKKEIYPRFDAITALSQRFLLVENNKKYGVISTAGTDIIPIRFDAIVPDTSNSIFICKQVGMPYFKTFSKF